MQYSNCLVVEVAEGKEGMVTAVRRTVGRSQPHTSVCRRFVLFVGMSNVTMAGSPKRTLVWVYVFPFFIGLCVLLFK